MPTPTKKAASKPAAAPDVDPHAALQAAADEVAARGFHGHSPDKTPRESYTLAGVAAGLPTPELERGK